MFAVGVNESPQGSKAGFTCAVVSILVQLVAGGTLTAVQSWLIGTVVFTLAVVQSTLIDV